jgi:hypothetical protein
MVLEPDARQEEVLALSDGLDAGLAAYRLEAPLNSLGGTGSKRSPDLPAGCGADQGAEGEEAESAGVTPELLYPRQEPRKLTPLLQYRFRQSVTR